MQVAEATLLKQQKNVSESFSNFALKNLSSTLCEAEELFKMITWISLKELM